MVLDRKSSQEYPLIVEFLKDSFLVLHFSCYTLMTYLTIICNIAIYADDTTTLYSKCDQASDLSQQLELASELEFDLRDTGLG